MNEPLIEEGNGNKQPKERAMTCLDVAAYDTKFCLPLSYCREDTKSEAPSCGSV